MKKIFSKAMKTIKENRKAFLACMMISILSLTMALGASASSATQTVVTPDDFSGVLTALQQQISVSTIVGVLVVVVGACIGLVFMWWGVRKVARAFMGAFRKGKMSV